MGRSSKKGPYVDAKLLKKVLRIQSGDLPAGEAGKTVVKTWKRYSTISPEMVGITFGVHNGKDFIPVFVSEDMVGHKLGEFSATKKFIRHGGKIQKELEASAATSASAEKNAAKTQSVGKK